MINNLMEQLFLPATNGWWVLGERVMCIRKGLRGSGGAETSAH